MWSELFRELLNAAWSKPANAKFRIIIVDKPGGLQRVLTNITEADANILSVHHTHMEEIFTKAIQKLKLL